MSFNFFGNSNPASAEPAPIADLAAHPSGEPKVPDGVAPKFDAQTGKPLDPSGGESTLKPEPTKPNSMEIKSLDDLGFLMHNDANGGTGAKPEALNIEQLLTPDALNKVAASLDFSSGMPPEVLEGLKSGDPASTIAALQHIGQQSYVNAMMHSGLISSKAIQSNTEVQTSNINNQINSSITDKQIEASIPGANNPVVANVVKGLTAQIKGNFPKATPEEIALMTQQSMAQLNIAMNPEQARPEDQVAAPIDWEAFSQDAQA